MAAAHDHDGADVAKQIRSRRPDLSDGLLGQLTERAGERSTETPIVSVYRAGRRSAQATLMPRRTGFELVANLAGGMLRWRARRGTVEDASE